jgi:hypothetical protein
MPQTPKEVTGVAPDIERMVKKRYERRQLQVQTEQEDQPGAANKPSLAFKTPSRIHNRDAAQRHSFALPRRHNLRPPLTRLITFTPPLAEPCAPLL